MATSLPCVLPYDILDIIFRFANLPLFKLRKLRLSCSTLRAAIDPILFSRFRVDLHNYDDLGLIQDARILDDAPGEYDPENASVAGITKKGFWNKPGRGNECKRAWTYVRQFVRVLHIRHDTSIANPWILYPPQSIPDYQNLPIEDFLAGFRSLSAVEISVKGLEIWGGFHGNLIESVCNYSPDLSVGVDLELTSPNQNGAFLPFDPFEPDNLMIFGSLDNITSLSLSRLGRIDVFQSPPMRGIYVSEPFLGAFAELISNSPNLQTLKIDYKSFERETDRDPVLRGYGRPLDLDVLFDLVGELKWEPDLQHLVACSAFLPLQGKHVDRWFRSLKTFEYQPFIHDEKHTRGMADLHRFTAGWRSLADTHVLLHSKPQYQKLKIDLSEGSMRYLERTESFNSTLKSLTLTNPHCNGNEYFPPQIHDDMPAFWKRTLSSFTSLEVLKIRNTSASSAPWWPTVGSLPRNSSLRRIDICPSGGHVAVLQHFVGLFLKDHPRLEVLTLLPGTAGYFLPKALLEGVAGKIEATEEQRQESGFRTGFQVYFKPPVATLDCRTGVVELTVKPAHDDESLEVWSYILKETCFNPKTDRIVCHQWRPKQVKPRVPSRARRNGSKPLQSGYAKRRVQAVVAAGIWATVIPAIVIWGAGQWCVVKVKDSRKKDEKRGAVAK